VIAMIAEYILQMDLTVADYLRNNIVFEIFSSEIIQ
jgi:hypothetical protein